ncbi:hypothetical protein FOXYSP1_19471 [Fusarium oxysporum f. sp. phaseoli]
MNDQPPSYQQALGISALNPNALLQIRLEVWHFFDLGRSPILNREFARLFRASNLANWAVREVQVIEPNNGASRDTFVPVQVTAAPSKSPIEERKNCTWLIPTDIFPLSSRSTSSINATPIAILEGGLSIMSESSLDALRRR